MKTNNILQLYPELNTFVNIKNLPKVDPNWLVGFSDGEASFYITISSSNSTKVKARVELSFFIKQAKESASALFAIQEFFGKGSIRWDDSAKKYLRFEIRSFEAITTTVIPFFNQYPLFSSKRANFLDLERVAHMIGAKEHLTQEGLDKIRLIKANMNSKRIYADKVNFMDSIKDEIKLTPGWLSGFIDAEGYFGIYTSNKNRRRCELKLRIAQNAHDLVLLEAIAKYLYIDTKIVNNLGKESTVKRLDIYKLDAFISEIVPIFDQYPLFTSKKA
jgi:hypothetical protein